MTIAELFQSRKNDPRWNMSYQLNPSDWAAYNDIEQFKQRYKDITLLGFDIGGGTPTSLSENNFSLLMQI